MRHHLDCTQSLFLYLLMIRVVHEPKGALRPVEFLSESLVVPCNRIELPILTWLSLNFVLVQFYLLVQNVFFWLAIRVLFWGLYRH